MAETNGGINAIIEKIREYADTTASGLIDNSTRKAEAAVAAAQEAVRSKETQELAALERSLAVETAQAETDYAAVYRDRNLALKQEMLGKTYSRAVELLAGLPSDKRLELYRKWLKKYGEQSDYRVILNQADRDEFGDILADEMSRGLYPGHPSLSAYCASISGGIILDFIDSKTDISFEAVVAAERGKGEGELIRILFAEGNN